MSPVLVAVMTVVCVRRCFLTGSGVAAASRSQFSLIKSRSVCTGHIIKFTLPMSEPVSWCTQHRAALVSSILRAVSIFLCHTVPLSFQSPCLEQASSGKSDLSESLCNYRELNG